MAEENEFLDSQDGVSEIQARKMYEWSVADHQTDANGNTIRGLSLEAANKALKERGLEPLEEMGPRNANEKTHDENFAPVSRPEQFTSNIQIDANSNSENENFNNVIRNALVSGEFDRQSGNSLVQQIDRNQKKISNFSQDEVRDLILKEKEKLVSVWGKENAQKKLGNIKEFITYVGNKSPGMESVLLNTLSLWTNSVTINSISAHVERLLSRHGSDYFTKERK